MKIFYEQEQWKYFLRHKNKFIAESVLVINILFFVFMLLFIGLGILVLLGVAYYIGKGKIQKEKDNTEIYDNTHLKEYLELPQETLPLDQYDVLLKASKYLIEKEDDIDKECKIVYSLFCGRMISSTLWEQFKKVKEEVAMDRITIDAELGRFSKMKKNSLDVSRVTPLPSDKKIVLSYTPDKEKMKSLYEKILHRKKMALP